MRFFDYIEITKISEKKGCSMERAEKLFRAKQRSRQLPDRRAASKRAASSRAEPWTV
ncbi:hypothetical protein ACLEVS_18065 [Escherichia coli]